MHARVVLPAGADACVCIGTVLSEVSTRSRDIKSTFPCSSSMGANDTSKANTDAAMRVSFGRKPSPCLGRTASSPASSKSGPHPSPPSKSGPRPAPPRVQRWLDTFSNLFPQEQREAFNRLAATYPVLLADHVRSRPPRGGLLRNPPSPGRTARVVRAPTHRRAPVLAQEPQRAPESPRRAPPEPPEHAPQSLNKQLRQMFELTKPKRPISHPETRAASAPRTPPPGAASQRPHSAPRSRPQASQPNFLIDRPSPRSLAAVVADAAVSTPPRRSPSAATNSTPGTNGSPANEIDETAAGGDVWAGEVLSTHAPLRSHASALPYHRSARWLSERTPPASPAHDGPASPPKKAKGVSPAAIRALHQTATIASYLRQLHRRESPQQARPDMSFDQAGAHASSVHNSWLASLRPSNNSPLPANAQHGWRASRADSLALSSG